MGTEGVAVKSFLAVECAGAMAFPFLSTSVSERVNAVKSASLD